MSKKTVYIAKKIIVSELANHQGLLPTSNFISLLMNFYVKADLFIKAIIVIMENFVPVPASFV